MADSVAQNAQSIRDIQEELSRVIKLDDYIQSLDRVEALRLASLLLRDFGLQVYTRTDNGEVAFWTFDQSNPVKPDPENGNANGYSGTKIFVVTTGS